MRVLRPESFWYRETGKVVSVDQVQHQPLLIAFSYAYTIVNDCWHMVKAAAAIVHVFWANFALRQAPAFKCCCAGQLTPYLYLQSGIRYPVVVRFSTVNYAGVSTNNYSVDEVEQL